MPNEQQFSSLKSLALAIKKRVDEGISNLSIKPQEEEYFRWKAENFRYTDRGPDYSARGEYFVKPSWFSTVRKLTEVVKQSDEHAFALEQVITKSGKSEGFSSFLDYFIMAVANQCVTNPTIKETDLDLLIATFVKDLLEEPVRYGANVELQGIVLHPESIEPSYGITLRKTKKEDVEKEYAVYGLMMNRSFLPHPSAIMRIEFLGRSANEVQKRVGKAIAILRLFKVGSVEFISSKMFSESIIDKALGTVTSGKARNALETYLVNDTDVQKLKKFWQTMNDSLPESFFWADVTSVDYLTIAYNRYSDALMENGLLERRIANAVMGLEALILTGETQELSYRLGIRISKLLSLLGHDPHEVKKIINDAYKVRSLFAHGGQLSYKRKEMLESRYGDAKNLLLPVLDYLRTLIIAMTLGKRGKDEFIDLVDDSLVDKKREERLNSIISQAKEVCAVN
jgi:hypothetical protein